MNIHVFIFFLGIKLDYISKTLPSDAAIWLSLVNRIQEAMCIILNINPKNSTVQSFLTLLIDHLNGEYCKY